MTLLWVALAFAAGCLFGAVMISLFAAGNRAEQDFEGGGNFLKTSIIRRYDRLGFTAIYCSIVSRLLRDGMVDIQVRPADSRRQEYRRQSECPQAAKGAGAGIRRCRRGFRHHRRDGRGRYVLRSVASLSPDMYHDDYALRRCNG